MDLPTGRGLDQAIYAARQAVKDALADCPSYPEHVSSGHALLLAELVDPVLLFTTDLAGAMQRLVSVLRFEGAPAAPCAKCLTAAPVSSDDADMGGKFHSRGCRCDCHRVRVEWFNHEQERAIRYASAVLQGLPVTPNPAIVGHLSAYLHDMARHAHVDRVQVEKIVEWLAVTDPSFRAMLTTLCHEAVTRAKTYGTLERVRAAHELETRAALAKETQRGTTVILEGGRGPGPGGGDAGAGG